ncbi:MAG: hypothetical protein K8S87_01335 [Planctomycetes bacterium]|nr:hypothetical protein [Planctomycetota bacterium]
MVNNATLSRDSTNDDIEFVFDRNNDKGYFVVDLIAEGDTTLTIDSIILSGAGFDSGEATIIRQPTTPFKMRNGNVAKIVIKVVSKLENSSSVTLTVIHSGNNSTFENEFKWEVDNSPHTFLFVLDRSASMSKRFPMKPPINDRSGNAVGTPNCWQKTQSEIANRVSELTEKDSFDVITFATSIYICFAKLKKATNGNKAIAVAWIYNQGTTGKSNMYDGLKAAFHNYGQVDIIALLSGGEADTALSLGWGNKECESLVKPRILKDVKTWINKQKAKFNHFEFKAIQIGGKQNSFMTLLGSLPNSTYEIK